MKQTSKARTSRSGMLPLAAPPTVPPPASRAPQTAPGARPSQEEINAALQEPHVRAIQEILNGKVRHIERQQEE